MNVRTLRIRKATFKRTIEDREITPGVRFYLSEFPTQLVNKNCYFRINETNLFDTNPTFFPTEIEAKEAGEKMGFEVLYGED